ncbi:MAG: hypothetical protein KGJ59_00670 [Bacteroidota bacterium]|nr:hypothetical protein [Bacteroidota bacterium]
MSVGEIRYGIFFLIISAAPSVCFAAGDQVVPTNRDVFSRLCAEAVDSIAALITSPRSSAVSVALDDDSTTQAFRYVILEALKHQFPSVFLKEANSDEVVSLTVSRASVRYENPFSGSFLGERKATRTAELQMRGTIVNVNSRQVLWAGTIERSFADTIPVSQIASLEFSSSSVAQGVVPEAPFLERLVEPMIIIAATGIAVYLFFTIRG